MNTARVYRMGKPEEDDSIQTSIPIWPKRNGPVSKYRARMERLEIGHSFFVPHGTRHGAEAIAKSVGITIETRAVGNGIRIWRKA